MVNCDIKEFQGGELGFSIPAFETAVEISRILHVYE